MSKRYVFWFLFAFTLMGVGILFLPVSALALAQASPLDAIDDFYTMTTSDATLTGNVLTNDVGSGLHVTQWNDPDHGMIAGNADGSFVYTPQPGYVGTVIFYYTVYDAAGARDASTVTITISGSTAELRAVDDTFEVVGNGITTSPVGRDFPAPGVLGNDSGDSIRVTSYTQPSNSNLRDVVVNPDGSFRFVLYPLFLGTDTFTYTITDAAGNTATATVTLNVVRPPLDAVDDAYTVEFETSNNVLEVMRNDTASGRRPGITILSSPSHGTYSYLGFNSAVSYTPNPGFFGTDTFRYRLRDPFGTTDEATVTITVLPPGPIDAIDDFFELSSDSPGLVANVLQNDHGVGLHVTEHTQPAHGTIHDLSADGWFGYTPEPGFIGSVVFYYTVYDAAGMRDASTVTITIVAVEAPLQATDDTFEVLGNGYPISGSIPRDFPAPGVLANDVGNGIYVSSYSQPTSGSVTVNGNGSFRYMVEPLFVGNTSFTYTITDAHGNTSTAPVTLNVVPTPLDAIDDAYTFTYESQGNYMNWPGNDVYSARRPRVDVLSGPSYGTLQSIGFGQEFLYTPNPGFSGVDTIRYRLGDEFGQSDEATVTITVSPPQGQPLDAIDDFYQMTTTDATLTANVLTNDVGSGLYVTQWNDPDHGSISGTADGNFVYTPEPGYVGTVIFYYTVYDAAGVRDASTVTINVVATTPADAGTSP